MLCTDRFCEKPFILPVVPEFAREAAEAAAAAVVTKGARKPS
jgi:hypothetical protein